LHALLLFRPRRASDLIQDAFVIVVTPPPVIGLGTLGGFKLQVEDRADAGPRALFAALSEALGKAYQNPALGGFWYAFPRASERADRKSTRLNSSHRTI